MSDDKLQDSIGRGARAARLLADDLLQECFAALEAEYLKAWRVTAARDTDARERLWQATQVLGKVRDHLLAVANNGKLAQRELDALQDKRARRSFFSG
jgi:hypothetical protein